MSLLDQIKNDQLTARKIKAQAKVDLLTPLFSEATMIGKNDSNRLTTDTEVIGVIKKFINGITECLAVAKDPLVITAYKIELDILNAYLPKQLTEQEIREKVHTLQITNPDFKIGDVMGFFKKNFGGLYDSRVLSNVVKDSTKA
jgi:uncharacterized protein YqeY